jgi:hypothetical protein
MEKRLSEVEAILKVSGIASASLLSEEVKGRVFHSVAIDIVAYYEPLIQQAKAEVAREIFEEIENRVHTYDVNGNPVLHIDFKDSEGAIRYVDWYKNLKSKYGGQK